MNLASLTAHPCSKSGHALDTGVPKRDTDAANPLSSTPSGGEEAPLPGRATLLRSRDQIRDVCLTEKSYQFPIITGGFADGHLLSPSLSSI